MVRKLGHMLGFALLVGIFCEVGSRLDDWFFDGVPIFANPTYEALFTTDEYGQRRGKPGARWKRVTLNNLGMRGPDVPLASSKDCHRWMFLGASETFGEPSRADAEYPSRVRALARQQSLCVDVLNTAYPGIAPRGLIPYYESALSQYKPEVVFVYPSTHFYLGDVGPRIARPEIKPKSQEPPKAEPLSLDMLLSRSRFWERFKDSAEVPAPIQEMRLRRWIDESTQGQPPGWGYDHVPVDRLDVLASDLAELVEAIRQSGAEPVLMTHAVRVANPPRPDDHPDLYSMRRYVPRASEAVIAEFEYDAARRVKQLGQELNVRVIDVASEMNGKRDRFIDLVHYTPQGHDEVARLIVHDMTDGTRAHAVQ